MTNWRELSARASLASHRLIGWIYWDPDAIARYTALGVPNGLGYYIASRAAPLASSGNDAVVAAFYSIRKEFIDLCLDTARKHTTFEDAYRVR
ncbi:MAG: helix-turn-helix domain-containing protein, partial [Acidimicrobiaceae bacterium]